LVVGRQMNYYCLHRRAVLQITLIREELWDISW
jgi:hypothetical protein